MSDILSQAEIDELLNALNAGGNSDKEDERPAPSKIKVYDFKTANKFPKEQMRTLNIVFQTFSQLFSNRLTSILRVSCECEVLSVEESSFNEFNNSLPIPVVLSIYKAPPMQGSQIMAISPEAVYMIINRLLGGSKFSGSSTKQFTEIELVLIERIFRQMISLFNDAWEKVFKVDAQMERVETSLQFAQIVALNEPVAIVGLNVRIGDESGLLSICIPHPAIEPVAKQLNTRMMYSSGQEKRKVDYNSDFISEKLLHSPAQMTAYFDQTPATVVDILNLQVGDVIRLNHKVKDPITIKIQHIPKFYGKIGTSNARYAVQIIDIIKEEKDG